MPVRERTIKLLLESVTYTAITETVTCILQYKHLRIAESTTCIIAAVTPIWRTCNDTQAIVCTHAINRVKQEKEACVDYEKPTLIQSCMG